MPGTATSIRSKISVPPATTEAQRKTVEDFLGTACWYYDYRGGAKTLTSTEVTTLAGLINTNDGLAATFNAATKKGVQSQADFQSPP